MAKLVFNIFKLDFLNPLQKQQREPLNAPTHIL